MLRFLIKRLLTVMFSLFMIVTLTFFLMKAIPGGPFASEKKLPEAVEKNINEKYHLDDPWYIQYKDYLIQTAKLDLGPSFRHENRTVNEIIADSFPVSAKLGFLAVSISLVAGLGIGITSALNRNRYQDYLGVLIATAGLSIPSFVLGFLFMYIFAYKLKWFPPAMWGSWKHIVLPALSLSLLPTAVIARLMRSSMIDVLRQDYILTAKAKGLKRRTIIYGHAVRNAILPVLTYLGQLTAGIFTGSFVIEHIFAIPGLGRYLVMSVQNRDYTVIIGTTVFYSAFLMLMNLVVDILYVVVDPRIRLANKLE